MSDSDGASDTEPGARPPASTDPGADTDPGATDVTDTVPTSPLHLEADTNDGTDDFFRWLPTMWLWQRRRKELVQRRSSDGADFVAYASTGRPVPAGPPTTVEASVQVQPTVSPEARDAPTVFLPKRSASGRQRAAVGFAVLLLVAMIGIAAWTHRPSSANDSAIASPTAAAPAQRASDLAAPAESAALSAAPVRATAEGLATHVSETRKDPGAVAGAPLAKDSPRKLDGSRVNSLGRDPAGARRPPPSETPAKDRYFEQP